ncbi:MAG: HesA/MoeB/ThiF family protein [Spirochaetales bacterium]|nr:MAG: HesA/MoeB/ThiF family protein [Spirochaetales bacterium]
MLTDRDKVRYTRQILLPEIGGKGQERLKGSTVFIAGAGGLGSPVSVYLACAGVGHLVICDDGRVELSNLNRQFLHADSRQDMLKTESAAEILAALNPDVSLTLISRRLTEENAGELVGGADIIVDCLDNFETRYVVNRYAVKNSLPFIHAGIYGMSGQLSFFQPPETACLACIFPEAPPPEIFPVLGAPVGVIGSLEALEAVKYLTGCGTVLKNRLLIFNGEEARFDEVTISRDPACPVCGGLTRGTA